MTMSLGTKRALSLAIPLVALALLSTSCGDDSSDTEGGGGRAVEVTAADFAFDTDSISAEPGESIDLTLVNSDDAEHSFTIDGGVVDVEAEGGEEATATFTAPDETVEFFCRYHPDEMRGELTIAGSSSDTGSESESTPASDMETGY